MSLRGLAQHNTHDWIEQLNALTPTLNRLAGTSDYADAVVATVRATLERPASGTMRAWMQAHHGSTVTTIQVVNRDSANAWCPTGRTIDATRASSVRLSGSTRDYKGMRVLHAADNCLIVADDWHTIAYVIEEDN